MTDRELMLLAAEAAGLQIERWAQEDYPVVRDGQATFGWCPLVFDSDALRLAVALRISIAFVGRALIQVSADGRPIVSEYVNLGADPNEATRRAIVQAAAAMASAKTPNAKLTGDQRP